MRYVACVHGMAGNHADRWGLSHLEPPKSQPTLELKSSQVGVPTCFFIRVFIDQIRCCPCARDGREQCRTLQIDNVFIDQFRYVAYVHGMAGNHADRWGLSHVEPPKSNLR